MKKKSPKHSFEDLIGTIKLHIYKKYGQKGQIINFFCMYVHRL